VPTSIAEPSCLETPQTSTNLRHCGAATATSRCAAPVSAMPRLGQQPQHSGKDPFVQLRERRVASCRARVDAIGCRGPPRVRRVMRERGTGRVGWRAGSGVWLPLPHKLGLERWGCVERTAVVDATLSGPLVWADSGRKREPGVPSGRYPARSGEWCKMRSAALYS
jgi:hypothetical protein